MSSNNNNQNQDQNVHETILTEKNREELGHWEGDTFIINEGVTSIGRYAFSDCCSLESIEIPSSVTSIGKFAFSNCESLNSIEIPSSVTSIGKFAFSNCESLMIKCKAKTKSEGWSDDWNSDNRPVELGFKVEKQQLSCFITFIKKKEYVII